MDIYSRVFQVVNKSIELPFDESRYLNIVRKNPYVVSMDEFHQIENEKDINAFFYRTLNRLDDQNIGKEWMAFSETYGFSNVEVFAVEVMSCCEFRESMKKFCLRGARIGKKKFELKIHVIIWQRIIYKRIELFFKRLKLHTVIVLWDKLSDEKKNKIRRALGKEEK